MDLFTANMVVNDVIMCFYVSVFVCVFFVFLISYLCCLLYLLHPKKVREINYM